MNDNRCTRCGREGHRASHCTQPTGCFGVMCPPHGSCAMYANVGKADHVIGTCLTVAGERPLYVKKAGD